MFDYALTALEALAVLVEFGGASPGVTLTRTTEGVYDPDTSTTSAPVETATAGVGLLFDYELQHAGAGTLDGTLIAAGDKRLYLAALDAFGAAIAAPLKGDACACPDGQVYRVENVKVVAPTGVPVLFDLQLRR